MDTDSTDYFPPRPPSIISSINSLYDQYRLHINILKWTGLVVMMALMASTLGIVSSSTTEKNTIKSDCIKVVQTNMENTGNTTMCEYIRKFNILHGCYLSVCKLKHQIVIDFRLFNGENPTTQGIFLDMRQFHYLQRLIPHIAKTIDWIVQRKY